jgi:pimeloyl-ACP methyl ester carboxylesterase
MMTTTRTSNRTCAFGLCSIAAALLTSLGALAQSSDKTSAVIDDPDYARAQRLVRIESDRRLNLYCKGTGSPIVVFDSGWTDETAVWGLVQPVISRTTRTCSYDRAGVGFSDPSTHGGTTASIVDDLHRLLIAASERPPYVLVGHSYGGLNVRYFANEFPAEVIGMVLVDPATEDSVSAVNMTDPQWKEKYLIPRLATLNDCVDGARTGFEPGTDLYKKCINKPDPHFSDAINAAHLAVYLGSGFQEAQRGEMSSVLLGVSADQMRHIRRSLSDMPLVVLSLAPSKEPLRPTETQQTRDDAYRARTKTHEEVASLSSRGIRRIIPDSGHYIQFDQPQAVIDAILTVLAAARK